MSGNKRLVYVMMKILKECHDDVDLTSYKVTLFFLDNLASKPIIFLDEICSRQVS